MAIITRRRKSGTKFQVKVRGHDGNWISETYLNKRDAQGREIELKHKQNKGETITNHASKISVDEFWLEWNDIKKAEPGWRKKQKQMYRDYIHPQIGGIILSQLKPADVSKIFSKMVGLGRSPQTQLHVYGILNMMLSSAVDDFSYLVKKPMTKKLRPKLIENEAQSLTYEEIITLLRYAEFKVFGLAVWIQIICGLRACEVCFLKWEHVDFENSILHIRGTWRRSEGRFVDHPKDGDWREVKIPSELLTKLIEAKKNSVSDFIMTSRDGSRFMSYEAYYFALTPTPA